MVRRYAQDLKLWRSRPMKVAMLALLVLWAVGPLVLTEFWVVVLNFCGVYAIGALGLMLLTGFTGQVSLGQAFFIGTGAYVAAWFGDHLDWPLLLWLPTAAIVGGLIGGAIGPFALRLRGQYLVIVTLGLLFVGDYIFNNWESVTGGGAGTSAAAPLAVGPIDFGQLELFGKEFSRPQGVFYLIWIVAAISAVLIKNIVRSRPGRALQAVRDRDVAAEVIGVSLARYKIGAFVISSALAAVAGGLYAACIQQYVSPSEFGMNPPLGLFLSIQYLAFIIVGGLGTVFGAVIGAIFVGAIPRLIERFSGSIPGVSTGPGDPGILTVFALNQMIFGALIVVFLALEPRGLAALWLRVKAYFKAWPFSY
ncbi:MAG: branched-chain amino acid ABC transporter permease [Acidimicrobiales bacterium]|nr:branched-chain amino acid ABC transporter permease [Acidimicrobiales bacterium]